MNFFDAQTDLSDLVRELASHEGLVVACYCAAWCDTCKSYRQPFEALSQRFPDHVFVWIDIEENEVLLGDEDVEDFPTLLIQGPTGNLFFGPMLPHIEHLERLLRGMDDSRAITAGGPGNLKRLVTTAAQ